MLIGIDFGLIPHVNSRIAVEIICINSVDFGESCIHERLTKLVEASCEIEHEAVRGYL